MLKVEDLINRNLDILGLKLIRKTSVTSSFSDRLLHMRGLGFSPRVIFDCGAFMGTWTLRTSRIFPDAQFVLMEPNQSILDETKANISVIKPRPLLLEIAVGEEPGLAYLNIWGNDKTSLAASSLLDHVVGEPNKRIGVEVRTLDMIAKRTSFTPNLVKLDLQGKELSALKGAENILKTAELFIIEFGCLEAYKDRTTPAELMDMMYSNSYCLYDIVDLYYRSIL